MDQQIQNKMKSTKFSAFTTISKKPDNFRVILKNRNNLLQRGQAVKRSESPQLTITPPPIKQQEQTKMIPQIKEYVRSRMKTQYGDNFKMTQSLAIQSSNSRHNINDLNNQQLSVQKQTERKRTSSRSSLNSSQIGFRNNPEIYASSSKIQPHPFAILKSLEEKIEALVDRRLNQCYTNKKIRNSDIQEELISVINNLRDIKESANPEQIQVDIAYFDKKIKLLEKLMAENMTQSDIMKKHFLSKVSNKSTHKRLRTEACTPNRYESYKRNESVHHETVVNASNSRESFQAPDRLAYKIYKYKNQFFNADRHKQPLPRSSYNRQYLVYGVSPETEIVPRDHQFMGRSNSSKMFNSCYRDSFGPKNVEKMNIKELDAYKDKIKNLPVIFGRKQKDILRSSIYVYLQKKSQEQQPKKYQEKPKVASKYLLTQSRRQFKKQIQNNLSSQIKNKNLEKIKYQYKSKMHV